MTTTVITPHETCKKIEMSNVKTTLEFGDIGDYFRTIQSLLYCIAGQNSDFEIPNNTSKALYFIADLLEIDIVE